MNKKFGVAITEAAHAKMRAVVKANRLGQNYIINLIFEHWDEVVDAVRLAPYIEQARADKPKRQVSHKLVKSLVEKLSPEERAKLMEQLSHEEGR